MAQKARVFISCGQRDGSEFNIAEKVKKALSKDKVFETEGNWPYVAKLDSSMEILLPEIFRRLNEAEYFIYLDFARESITVNDKKGMRGSLFALQEWAIATFLGTKRINFREETLLSANDFQYDGMCSQTLFNAPQGQTFPEVNNANEDEVVDIIVGKIQSLLDSKEWDGNWRNELCLGSVDYKKEGSYSDTWDFDGEVKSNQRVIDAARYYHVEIHNRHRSEIARGCIIYLNKLVDLITNEEIELNIVETKWTSIRSRDTFILPGKSRKFDLLRVCKNQMLENAISTAALDIRDSDSFINLRCNYNRELVDDGGAKKKYYVELSPKGFPLRKRLFFTLFSDNFSPYKFELDLIITMNTFGNIEISPTQKAGQIINR